MATMRIDINRYDDKDFELEQYRDYSEITSIVEPYQKYQFMVGNSYNVDIFLKEGEMINGTETPLDGLRIGDILYKTYFRTNGPIVYHDERSTELTITDIYIKLKIIMGESELSVEDVYIGFNGEKRVWAYAEYSKLSIFNKGFSDKGCWYSLNKEDTDSYYDGMKTKFDEKLPSILAGLPSLATPQMYFKYYEGGEGQSGNMKYYEARVHRTNGLFADVALYMQMGNSDNYYVTVNETYKRGSSTYYPKKYSLDEVPDEYKWVVERIEERHRDDLLRLCNPNNFNHYRKCSFCGKKPESSITTYGYGAVACEDCKPYTVFYIGHQDDEYEQENNVAMYSKDITLFQEKCACGCDRDLLEGFDLTNPGPTPNYEEFLDKKYRRDDIDRVVRETYEAL
jgi:hypothetical protein